MLAIKREKCVLNFHIPVLLNGWSSFLFVFNLKGVGVKARDIRTGLL
jgi:hypothetical protein